MIFLRSPWVAHLYKLIAVCLNDAKDSVGVTLDEALSILVGVVASTCVHLDELINFIAV